MDILRRFGIVGKSRRDVINSLADEALDLPLVRGKDGMGWYGMVWYGMVTCVLRG